MHVLIVDDDRDTRDLIELILSASDYEVTKACDGVEALDILRQGDIHLVVTDWEMPEMNGIELCRRIRSEFVSGYIYVLIVTSRSGRENVLAGLDAGADDYIAKPYDNDELIARVRTGERVLGLETRELVIFAMASLAESRDPETGQHLDRIRTYARILAEEVSGMDACKDRAPTGFSELVWLTSPLHDIGKVGIPDYVLLKPDRLTDAEFAIMKKHSQIGGQTIEMALNQYSAAPYLQYARDIAMYHHERYDGGGYPTGMKGDDAPLSAQVVALADVYDALTVRRCYKSAFSHEVARNIILQGKGTQFAPYVVDAFQKREEDIIRIAREMGAD
ncbi:MAG: two-component system response regulator [Candidatus Sumerlaeia bacterium]